MLNWRLAATSMASTIRGEGIQRLADLSPCAFEAAT
jgi:hypothetical protein